MSDVEPERPLSELHLWEIRGIRDVLIVLVCALLFWLGYAMRDVTIPLLVALLLAYLFEPAIALIARTRWVPFGRIGAVSLLLTVISLIVLAAAALLVPRVVSQAVDLVGDVRSGLVRDRLTRFVTEYVPMEYRTDALMLVAELPSGKGDESEAALIAMDYGDNSSVPIVPPTATKSASANDTQPDKTQGPESPAASSAVSDAAAAASSTSFDMLGFAKSTGQLAWAVIADVIAISMLLFLIPFYFFFFSVSYPKVLAFFEDLLPDRSRSTIHPLLRRMDGAVAGFVRGELSLPSSWP